MSQDRREAIDFAEDEEPTGAEQAGGHQHAIETLAKVRREALNAVVSMNANPDFTSSPLLSHGSQRAKAHAQANAVVATYVNLVTKPRWIQRHDAKEYVQNPFTTTVVPAGVLDEGGRMPQVKVDSMAKDTVDAYFNQIEMAEYELSLADVTEFSNWDIPIAKVPGNPYESHRRPEVERRRLVLPPRVLEDVFNRTDSLADYFGFLMEMEDAGKEVESSYSYVMGVANEFESNHAEELQDANY